MSSMFLEKRTDACYILPTEKVTSNTSKVVRILDLFDDVIYIILEEYKSETSENQELLVKLGTSICDKIMTI